MVRFAPDFAEKAVCDGARTSRNALSRNKHRKTVTPKRGSFERSGNIQDGVRGKEFPFYYDGAQGNRRTLFGEQVRDLKMSALPAPRRGRKALAGKVSCCIRNP